MPTSSSLGIVNHSKPPAPTPLPPVEHEEEECEIYIPVRTLTISNAAMSLFHTGLLSITLLLGNRDLSVPIYKTDLQFTPTENSTSFQLIPVYREAGTLPFTWLTASFFFLSALFHLLNATCLRSFYLSSLKECLSPTRYAEYTFSAAVMQVLIAYTAGVRERMLLLASAVLIGITMPFGYWGEQIARPDGPYCWRRSLLERLSPWLIGHIPQVTAWLILFVNFYDSGDGMAPDFVQVILWGEMVLFFSFGFVALYQQLTIPKNFYKGEIAFQALSLVSKGLLGGILIANVLLLSSFEDIYS